MKKTSSISEHVLDIVVYLILILVVLITLYPFWNIFIISINDPIDTIKGGLYFLPRKLSFASYQTILTDSEFVGSLKITLLRTVIGTPVAVLATSMLAFVLSKKELLGRKFFSLLFIFTMYFGGGLIPYYMVLKSIHLIDNFWVYIFPNLISVFNMILVKAYIDSMPAELFESAKIDGANDLVVFFRMVLPLAKPVLATIALFIAIMQWNSWFDSYVFTSSPGLKTMQAVLVKILNQYQTGNMASAAQQMADSAKRVAVTSDSIRMTATMVSTIPIILVYPFVQKYFVKGIMVGAIKD
ncbi:carbohydrate ABC transporter permease [Clostridium sp. SYSU_GA19001]|uniref:carbohydrate ABC transporter permease n=1 Tax=Clostridium caldaquaticum TaxID=2940653 RepID=UPI002077618D|nr:carbohydrate ABC transporter permease [Clostridium caldaquaticum]MCM8710739.1 carbohydrate ABC transporter permease [Clostridium caldaquaticum]